MIEFHRLPVGLFATNCVLINDESLESIIVDPGGDKEVIQNRVKALGLKPVMVVLTHAHLDHCLEATSIAKTYACKIAMHEKDLPMYLRLKEQAYALVGAFIADTLEEPKQPDLFLEDNQILTFGKSQARVLHLPGHSPGGIGLYFGGQEPVLVCGDTIFRDGIGRTDLWGGDYETLIASIKNKVFALEDRTRLIPGHGAETTVGREKRYFMF
jgi:glyoxylase-like metal-dependent hydrolase (beta-lactamase superfamily II)